MESYYWAVRPVGIRQHLGSRVAQGHSLFSKTWREKFRPRQRGEGRRITCAMLTTLSLIHGVFQCRIQYQNCVVTKEKLENFACTICICTINSLKIPLQTQGDFSLQLLHPAVNWIFYDEYWHWVYIEIQSQCVPNRATLLLDTYTLWRFNTCVCNRNVGPEQLNDVCLSWAQINWIQFIIL